MKMKSLAVTVATTVIALSAGLNSLHAASLAEIKKRGTIRVATDLGVPPYASTDANMQPQGSDVDTAKKLAADLGVKLEIVPVTGPNRVPFLLTDKADAVISSFSITDERKKVVNFSRPYGALQLVVAAPESVELKDAAGLKGKSIGVVRGNVQDTVITQSAPAGTNIMRYDDDATVSAAVISGQVDAFCTNAPLVKTLADRNPKLKITSRYVAKLLPYAIGMRKQDEDLRVWVNDWIAKSLKDGSLGKIYEKWMKVPLPDLSEFARVAD